MPSIVARMAALAAVCALAVVAPTAAQQGSPVTGRRPAVVAELFVGAFAMPAVDAQPVGFARYEIAPEADLALPPAAGPAVHVVLAGELEVRPAGPAATPVPDVPRQIAAGDPLVVPAGAGVVLHNAGTAPAATLAVEFFGPPAGPDPVRRDLGSATVRLPTGAARVEVRRQRFVLGAVDQIAALPGPELVVVETGAVELALHPGTARVTRIGGEHETVSGAPGDPFATAEPDPMEATEAAEDAAGPTASAGGPAVAALNGTVVGLGSGDAAALEAGAARTLQGVDVGESVVLVIGVVPAVPVPATPAP